MVMIILVYKIESGANINDANATYHIKVGICIFVYLSCFIGGCD